MMGGGFALVLLGLLMGGCIQSTLEVASDTRMTPRDKKFLGTAPFGRPPTPDLTAALVAEQSARRRHRRTRRLEVSARGYRRTPGASPAFLLSTAELDAHDLGRHAEPHRHEAGAEAARDDHVPAVLDDVAVGEARAVARGYEARP